MKDIKGTSAGAELVELAPEDDRWARFVRDAPGATPFHLPEWLRALRATYGYKGFVAARLDEAGQVQGGLPLLRVLRPLSGPVHISLPFTDHVGLLSNGEEGARALQEGLRRWRLGRRGARVEVRASLPAVEGEELQKKVEAGVRHLLSLEHAGAGGPRLKPSVARHVKAAERAGVRVRFGHSARDLSTFYSLHLQTRRRLGVPVQPRRFLEAVWRHLVAPGLGFIAIAETRHGEPLAAALFLFHNGTLVYKYGASDAAHWQLKPNHLLFWRVIEWGSDNGLEVLDFGRSDMASQGLRQFKSSWGSTEVPLHYTRLGWTGGASGGGGRLSTTLGAVIRRSPPVVCRAIGELLYRYAA